MIVSSLKDQRFYFLWLASVLGAMAVLPYASTVIGNALTMSMVFRILIQSILLYAFIVFFGVWASEKAGFQIIPSQKYKVEAILCGVAVGLVLKLFDEFMFKGKANVVLSTVPDVKLMYRVVASFYGAINEEVLLRLFAVSSVVLFLRKFIKLSKQSAVITSIGFCALLFAAGHLPALYKVVALPNTYDIVRVMSLNSLAGIVFGLLYWRYGLIASMLSHFTADLLIHVF